METKCHNCKKVIWIDQDEIIEDDHAVYLCPDCWADYQMYIKVAALLNKHEKGSVK